MWGGLLQQTTDVENYPGYPQGVMGPQMMQGSSATKPSASARASSPRTRPGSSPAPTASRTVWIDEDEYKAP